MNDTPRERIEAAQEGPLTFPGYHTELIDADKALQAMTLERDRMRAALETTRAFVQDSLDTAYDRKVIGNLMSARDTIDAALAPTGDTP